MTRSATQYGDSSPIDTRLLISALWIAVLLIFAYVDLFYALSIVGSAVGEWNYFILGSVVEAVLLALVIHHAWTWPRETASTR